MSGTLEIYVRLLDEAVDVWRPVRAERIREDVYRIVEQPYDRGVDKWEFEPGVQVICQQIETSDGRIVGAVRKVDNSSE